MFGERNLAPRSRHYHLCAAASAQFFVLMHSQRNRRYSVYVHVLYYIMYICNCVLFVFICIICNFSLNFTARGQCDYLRRERHANRGDRYVSYRNLMSNDGHRTDNQYIC